MSALPKRKRGAEQEDCDPISKGQVKEEDPPASAPIKKLKSEGTLPATRTESVEIVKAETEKRNQAVAFKIAMELLQQLQHQDGTLSAELVDAVEEIMVHTRTVVAFAKVYLRMFSPTQALTDRCSDTPQHRFLLLWDSFVYSPVKFCCIYFLIFAQEIFGAFGQFAMYLKASGTYHPFQWVRF